MPIVTPDWVRDAVFYQIFPDRFASSDRVVKPGPLEPWDMPPTLYGFKGGDLLGVVERLPYLAYLGITAIYLTPVFASASNHRYHTYDYLQVDPLLGGDAALRELLDSAHARPERAADRRAGRSFPRDEAAWDHEVLEFVHASLALRREEAALRRGSFRVAAASGGGLAFERTLGEQRVVVALNAGEAEVALDLNLPGVAGCRLEPCALHGVTATAAATVDATDHTRLVLAARSAAVFRLA